MQPRLCSFVTLGVVGVLYFVMPWVAGLLLLVWISFLWTSVKRGGIDGAEETTEEVERMMDCLEREKELFRRGSG